MQHQGDPLNGQAPKEVSREGFTQALESAIQKSETAPTEDPVASHLPDGDLKKHVQEEDPGWFKYSRFDHRIISSVINKAGRLNHTKFYRDTVLNPNDNYIPPARRVQVEVVVGKFKRSMGPIEKELSQILAMESAELVKNGQVVDDDSLADIRLNDKERRIAEYRAKRRYRIESRYRARVEKSGGEFLTRPETAEETLREEVRRAKYRKRYGSDKVVRVQHGMRRDGRLRQSIVPPDRLKARMAPLVEQAKIGGERPHSNALKSRGLRASPMAKQADPQPKMACWSGWEN